MKVDEMKGVEDDAGGVGEGVGLDDVHAPPCEHPGDGGEKSGAIRGKQRERESVGIGVKFGLHRLGTQLLRQGEMHGNLHSGVDGEIAARKAFEETLDLFRSDVGDMSANLFEQRKFVVSV